MRGACFSIRFKHLSISYYMQIGKRESLDHVCLKWINLGPRDSEALVH
jgi:hypothetical protein